MTDRPATGPFRDRPASYARMFADRVADTPDREAFRSPRAGGGWQSLTWRQTAEKVDELSAGLIALGVEPEQRVAIASGTRIEWVLADLAIMCCGAAVTTVYPATNAEDVEYILSDSDSRVVVAENPEQAAKVTASDLPALQAIVLIDGAADEVTGTRVPVLTIAELQTKGAELLATDAQAVQRRIDAVEPEHVATVIYTSGTTGRPKGVRLVNANWTYEAVAIGELGILTPDDIQYLWLPLSHVFGKVLLVAQIQVGFVTAVDGDLDRIVANLAEIRPTWMGGAPRVFEKVRNKVTLTATGGGGIKAKIFDWAFRVGVTMSRARQSGTEPGRALRLQYALADRLVYRKIKELLGGRIRFFISGSAPLSQGVAEWFDAAGAPILEGYGLTESSAFSFVNLPHDYRIGTVGPPAPGTEVIIAADGEIMLRGPGIMRGYHGDEAATAAVLSADGWLATGDIGEVTRGYLKVTDRKKDLIKTSGGKYVPPQKVEGIFKAICPYLSQIIVHGDGRKFVSALITLDEEAITGWAKQQGLGEKSFDELATSPEVDALISGYIDQLNAKLERWETVKKFIILPRDLTVDAGELTPSMKVRRRAVEQQFADQLDALYAE